MIDLAKNKAAAANDTAGSTMDRLDDIKKEIAKIKVAPSNSNLSNVLNDVDQTGESYTKGTFFCVVCVNDIFGYFTAFFCPLFTFAILLSQ